MNVKDYRLYNTWSKMVRRCTSPKDSGWEYYGVERETKT